MTTTTRKKTVSQRNIQPPEVITEVHLIPLDRIEITAQVRTLFDDESIRELADDIETRGMLQPVLVSPIGDEKYRLVCGERRVRAIRALGHKAVPAVITKMSDRDARLAQLAENIQREDLSLEDRMRAVKLLYDELGTVAAVAATVKRSKAWVSKLMALTLPDYSQRAKDLFANGYTEDLEILGMVNQAELIGWDVARELANEVIKGMNRQQVRDWLKAAKEKKNQADAEYIATLDIATLAEKAKAKKEAAKPKGPPPFIAEREIHNIEREVATGMMSADEVKQKYSAKQWAELTNQLADCHIAGQNARASDNAVVMLAAAIEQNGYYGIELVAILRGFMDCEIDLLRIVGDAMDATDVAKEAQK